MAMYKNITLSLILATSLVGCSDSPPTSDRATQESADSGGKDAVGTESPEKTQGTTSTPAKTTAAVLDSANEVVNTNFKPLSFSTNWTSVAPPPSGFRLGQAIAIWAGSEIFALEYLNTAKFVAYNPATKSWRTLNVPSELDKTGGIKLWAIGDRIVAWIAVRNAEKVNDFVVYDVLTNSWKKVDPQTDFPPRTYGYGINNSFQDTSALFVVPNNTTDAPTYNRPIYKLNPISLTWKKISITDPENLSSLASAPYSLDSVSGRVYRWYANVAGLGQGYFQQSLLSSASWSKTQYELSTHFSAIRPVDGGLLGVNHQTFGQISYFDYTSQTFKSGGYSVYGGHGFDVTTAATTTFGSKMIYYGGKGFDDKHPLDQPAKTTLYVVDVKSWSASHREETVNGGPARYSLNATSGRENKIFFWGGVEKFSSNTSGANGTLLDEGYILEIK